MINSTFTDIPPGEFFPTQGRFFSGGEEVVTSIATFDCVDGECINPGDGSGAYATLALCKADCCSCPVVTLVCDSISASKSKCGVTRAFDGKLYTRVTISANRTRPQACRDPSDGLKTCSSLVTVLSMDPTILSFDENCTPSTHPGSITVRATDCDSVDSDSINSISSAVPGPPWVVTHSGTTDTYTLTTTFASVSCTPPTWDDVSIESFNYSNEYTTELLKSNTIAALPAYAGFGMSHGTGQGSTCSAFANLSVTESSYTIRRFRHKFQFNVPSCCFLRIYWNHTFRPTLTADVTYLGILHHKGTEDPDPSHWTITPDFWTYEGTPDAMGGCNSASSAESPTFDVDEPDTNGTSYLTDIRWSTDEAYEPAAESPPGVNQFARTDHGAGANCSA